MGTILSLIDGTHRQLQQLFPVLEASLSRLNIFYKKNFEEFQTNLYPYYEYTLYSYLNYHLKTSQASLNEYIKLEKEFIEEMQKIKSLIKDTEPITMFGNDMTYVHWSNKLYPIEKEFEKLHMKIKYSKKTII